LSTLSGSLASGELEECRLRFLEADIQPHGTLSITYPNREQLESLVDLREEGTIRFFQLTLKPVGLAAEDISVWLDNVTIGRENFSLPGTTDTLYLNNSELVYYPIAGMDLRRGFFEAIITPDWTREGRTTLKVEEAFTIFSAKNDHDESFSMFYDEREGLMLVATTAETQTIMSVGRIIPLEQYAPIKFSVAWDSEGTRIQDTGANVILWLDDVFVGTFSLDWNVQVTKNTYFFIGSRAYQSDVAFNAYRTYGTQSGGIKIVPKIQSITGGVENVLIAAEPRKVDFDAQVTLKDKILISPDGVNYVPGNDVSLPFIYDNVAPDDSFSIWLKTNFPQDTTNMSRIAHLRTRWRTG
jgi:hypothetical protein